MFRITATLHIPKHPTFRLTAQITNTNAPNIILNSACCSGKYSSAAITRHFSTLQHKKPNKFPCLRTQSHPILAKSTHFPRPYSTYSSYSSGNSNRGGPFSQLNDRIYMKLADMAYNQNTGFLPSIYIEGDRNATIALFWLVVAHVVLYFVLTYAMPMVGYKHFTVSRENIMAGRLYVVLTHALNHESFFHMLLNTYVLMNMAPPLLAYKGLTWVATLYLTSCFVGGSAAALSTLQQSPFQHGSGSSTGLFGLFAAYTLMFPNAMGGIILLPFNFKMQHMFLAVMAIESARYVMTGSMSAAGHLGGALGGALALVMRR